MIDNEAKDKFLWEYLKNNTTLRIWSLGEFLFKCKQDPHWYFFYLWNYSIKQDWWYDFLEYAQDQIETIWINKQLENLINPDRFATTLYGFLNDRSSKQEFFI